MNPVLWIKEKLKKRLGVPSVERSLEALAQRGFSPRVVFDVGAYHGEFALTCRRLFHPAPRVHCFEPLASALVVLTALKDRGEIVLHPGLVGAKDLDTVTFHEMETASSVLPEHHTPLQQAVAAHRMMKLDSVIGNGVGIQPPDLLKIDTQGYEMEVLKGAVNNLPRIRAVLAEVNFLDIHRGVALMFDVTAWLAAHGLVPYDICSVIRRPLDGALWQSDFIFLHQDDPLRQDKRWA
jgi:FkbM family methyltransferase